MHLPLQARYLRAEIRHFLAHAQVLVEDLHAMPPIEFRQGGGDAAQFVP
jgi:hypothetical protein